MNFLNKLNVKKKEKNYNNYYEELKPLIKEGLVREVYSDENYSVICVNEQGYFISDRELKYGKLHTHFSFEWYDIKLCIENGSDGLAKVFSKYTRESVIENMITFPDKAIIVLKELMKEIDEKDKCINVPECINFENELKEIMISKGIDPSIYQSGDGSLIE